MPIQKAKFSIGDVVKHRHFDFRGVIYDVDFEFNNSEEWYQSIPKNVRPRDFSRGFIFMSFVLVTSLTATTAPMTGKPAAMMEILVGFHHIKM